MFQAISFRYMCIRNTVVTKGEANIVSQYMCRAERIEVVKRSLESNRIQSFFSYNYISQEERQCVARTVYNPCDDNKSALKIHFESLLILLTRNLLLTLKKCSFSVALIFLFFVALVKFAVKLLMHALIFLQP